METRLLLAPDQQHAHLAAGLGALMRDCMQGLHTMTLSTSPLAERRGAIAACERKNSLMSVAL